jgi:Tripartite tricarboxylate transporter family receptor
LFKTKAGIDMLHVPFKGLSPMLTELLADRIDLSIAPLPGLIGQQIEQGTVRACARSRERAARAATGVGADLREVGVTGVEADAWSALFAPTKTPPAVVERLYRAVAAGSGCCHAAGRSREMGGLADGRSTHGLGYAERIACDARRAMGVDVDDGRHDHLLASSTSIEHGSGFESVPLDSRA